MNVTAPGNTKRQPTCEDWQRAARKRWRRLARVKGCGSWALVSSCAGPLTVSLWPDPDEAVAALDRLDRIRCGSRCTRLHELVDLEGAA